MKDEHSKNPYSTRNLVPTTETKLGVGYMKYDIMDAPADEGDGTPVDQWKGVHVTFYADAASYTGLYMTVIPWRWFGRSREGMSAAVPIGRWVAEQEIEVALDPALITGNRGSHYIWDTRDCESMVWQITGFYDVAGTTAARPDWIVIQPYGLTSTPVIATASGISGGGGSGAVLATHGVAVISQGPQIEGEAKDFDGAALPNNVAEGEAARLAVTRAGIAYSFLTNEGGDETPIAGHDESITAGKGGTVGVMQIVEAHDFDGNPLPVVGNEATRPKATMAGVSYTFLVNELGDGTPVAKHGDTLLNVANETHGLLGMGRGIDVLPAAVDNLDGVALATDLYGRMMDAAFQLASQSNRGEEINPLDTRDNPSILADGAVVVQNTTVDFYVPMSHMKGLSIHWEPGDGNFTLKVYATDEDNGTALAACNYHDVTNDWFGAASFTADMFDIATRDVCAYGVHIEVVRADVGGNVAHELFIRRNY